MMLPKINEQNERARTKWLLHLEIRKVKKLQSEQLLKC